MTHMFKVWMIDMDDKLPLVNEAQIPLQPRRSNSCLKFCKNSCIIIFLFFVGIFAACATVSFTYALTPKGITRPNYMLDDRCFAVISIVFPRIIQEKSSDGIIEGIANRINDQIIYEKLQYHKHIRNQYYTIDPLTILKILYAVLTIIFVVRCCCCCIFKTGKNDSFAFWFFIVYYFTLLSILGFAILTTLPLLDKKHPQSCDKQFWGYW
uniref:Uncharacterized protein n=1 Tax=Panagrolaimus sp. PS1159 TaxID=55785 RepID=A0AC35FYF3_9BILA